MKWRTEIRTRLVNFTVGDRTAPIEEKYEERIPVPPRDWDELSTKAGFGLVGLLTAISIVWSTVSIGQMLGGGVGFLAALLFDVSWAVCLILEWKARFDPNKRSFPRNLGWILLFVTMLFIGWHGIVLGNVPLAVVGASVSLFAKVLWLGIMKHVDRELSPEHQKWVNAVISEANAKMAVAQVLRRVAHVEDAALATKLSLEMSRNGLGPITTAVQVPDSAGQVPDMSGQAPDNSAAPPRPVSGQHGTGGAPALSTGSAAVRRLSGDDISILKDAESAAAFVRTSADLGVRTLPDMQDIARDLGLKFKDSTIERAYRREEGKKTA